MVLGRYLGEGSKKFVSTIVLEYGRRVSRRTVQRQPVLGDRGDDQVSVVASLPTIISKSPELIEAMARRQLTDGVDQVLCLVLGLGAAVRSHPHIMRCRGTRVGDGSDERPGVAPAGGIVRENRSFDEL